MRVARSCCIASRRKLLARTLGLALSAAVGLVPPPVLPLPSRSGPEGPPRSFGYEPLQGPRPAATAGAIASAQNHALLDGPFPHHGLARGVSEGALLLSTDASVRRRTLARIREAGATIVRIPVDWRDTAPETPRAGFNALDPAAPAYSFAPIDAAVTDAVAAGLRPLLVVSHAPAFAEAPGRWRYAYPGSWAPSPSALEAYAAALARRYDGAFPDPSAPGRVLPEVTLFQAWNEPNLARYLEPQWVVENGRWAAFSPLLYRQMLNAFYGGVKSVAPADLVVTAGVAPNGERDGVGRMAPVRFLRALLCLRPARSGGAALIREPCGERAHFDVLAFHPFSVADPDLAAASSLDVAISDAAKITGLLALAQQLHTALPAGPKPVWVTELNWESAPQVTGGVPPAEQPGWISRALHRLWVAGIGMAGWQFLIDPYPGALASTPSGAITTFPRPAGLYSAAPGGDPEGAVAKPFLAGFRFPFDPLRVDRANVRVWALLDGADQSVLLQRQTSPRAWRTIRRLRGAADGVLNTLVPLRGAATLRLTRGSATSAAARVPDANSRL